jgi:flagellar biosynthesis component FlhA
LWKSETLPTIIPEEPSIYADQKYDYYNAFNTSDIHSFKIVLPDRYFFWEEYLFQKKFYKKVNKVREKVLFQSGIIIPPVELDFDNSVTENSYEIYYAGKLVIKGCLYLERFVISEETLLSLCSKVPEKTLPYLNTDGTQSYLVTRDILKPFLKQKKEKFYYLSLHNWTDLLMQDIKRYCYNHIEDIISLSFVQHYLNREFTPFLSSTDGLPYKDQNSHWHFISYNEVRKIFLELLKNNVSLYNKDLFLQKLFDTLSTYKEINSRNVNYVIFDILESYKINSSQINMQEIK